MFSIKKKIKIYNQCINEFRQKFERYLPEDDNTSLRKLKAAKFRDGVLETIAEPKTWNDKEIDCYKDSIKKHLVEIVIKSFITAMPKLQKEIKTIQEQIEHFEKSYASIPKILEQFPQKINDKWQHGGRGIIITNDRCVTGRDRDITVLYSDDYRYYKLLSELQKIAPDNSVKIWYAYTLLAKEYIETGGNTDELNKNLFDNIIEMIQKAFQQELHNLHEQLETYQIYSKKENYFI